MHTYASEQVSERNMIAANLRNNDVVHYAVASTLQHHHVDLAMGFVQLNSN